MKFKNLVKLSAPVLALLLATACSNGQEDVVPQDEPVNQNLDVPVIEEENSNELEEDSESETPENNNLEEESLTEDTEEDLLEEESDRTELEEDPLNSENAEDKSIE